MQDPYGSVYAAGVVFLAGMVLAVGFALVRGSRRKAGEALAFALAYLAGYLIVSVALGLVTGAYF
ncbi:hypothetical protein M9M90_12310 [Phenylobacterium sp. LH3H17]|uniref:hypothetical protein n=1 Tax=Phenylobacterium sp. LH3H17 TaxID=2903901 RepID=UPI0020C95D23|nr:hypothetical protein [Phenylobacterium sp. LH3H17]UTP38018.1 hypothetical protein M9M90_12310 [Phenylobacterium sp. LH3H17]